MSKVQVVDINAAGGAGTNISFTGWARRVEIRENSLKADGVTANVPQGFQFTSLLDNFTKVIAVQPTEEPVILPHNQAPGFLDQRTLGLPQQGQPGDFNFRAADFIIKGAVSLTATGTTLHITEFD